MRSLRDAVLRCERHASKHHGIISRGEAFEFGMTKRVLERLIEEGAWTRLHAGVYRIGGFPDSWRGRLLAALLWAGPDAFVSHRSAAALYGLDGFHEGPIEITVPRSKSAAGVKLHRQRRPARVRVIDGIRVSWVERTLLDVCSSSSPLACGLAIDDALRRKLVTLDGLCKELNRCGSGVKGTKILRMLVTGRDDRDGKLASRLEAKLLAILRRIREEAFEAQYPVEFNGKNYRIDFFHPGCHLGIEGHSFRWHFGGKAHDEDAERHNDLTLMGIRMLYFTWDEIHFRADDVEAKVRTALGLPRPGQTAA